MNKQELINQIAASTSLTKADSAKALNAFTTIITDTLTKGDSIILTGFGTFSVKDRAARTGRNPSTGKALKIPAKKVVKLSIGKLLAEAVNK